MVHQRRTAAAFFAALTLYSSAAPSIALGGEGIRVARERALAIAETVEVFGRDGEVRDRIEGTRMLSRLSITKATELAVFDSLKTLILSAAERRIIDTARFSMTLQVIEALKAPTDDEYRQRMDNLPISISRTDAQDRFGRAGIQTEYRLRGTLKVRTFKIIDDGRSYGTPLPSREWGGDGEPEALASEPSWPRSSARDICGSYDLEDNYYEDECATQQEIDDATSAFIAMEDEAYWHVEEGVGEFMGFCTGEEAEEWEECEEYLNYYEPLPDASSAAPADAVNLGEIARGPRGRM